MTTDVLKTDKDGMIELNTIESQMALATKLLQNKLISDTFKSPQQVVIAIQYCKSLNIDPMVGLKMLYVVHGKPALYGDGPLSLIQSTGKLEWIEEYWVDDNGDRICVANKNLKKVPYAAICRLKRVNDPQIQEDYFSLDDMQLAQMKSPTWTRYQRIMMRYRARTQALKSKFADLLNGIDIAEYVSNDLPREGYRIDSPQIEDITQDQTIQIRDLLKRLNKNEPEFMAYFNRVLGKNLTKLTELNTEEANQAITQLSQFKAEIVDAKTVGDVAQVLTSGDK